MNELNVRVNVTQGGRIVIPAEMRKYMGIEIGEYVTLSLKDDSVIISTSKNSLLRIQKLAQTVAKGEI